MNNFKEWLAVQEGFGAVAMDFGRRAGAVAKAAAGAAAQQFIPGLGPEGVDPDPHLLGAAAHQVIHNPVVMAASRRAGLQKDVDPQVYARKQQACKDNNMDACNDLCDNHADKFGCWKLGKKPSRLIGAIAPAKPQLPKQRF